MPCSTLAATLAALVILGPGPITNAKPGSPVRRAVLDGLRPTVQKDLGQRVSFVVRRIRVQDRFAFVEAEPVQPNGKPINLRRTRYRQAVEDGVFDGPTLWALLRRDSGKWRVLEYVLGPTDVAWDGWERHGCTRALLGLP